MRLNKQDLITKQEQFTMKPLNNEQEIALRYLTQTEINQIKQLYNKGKTTSIIESDNKKVKTIEINEPQNIKARQEAKGLALSYALSCDGINYTTDDVDMFLPCYVESIWKLVCEMNNL